MNKAQRFLTDTVYIALIDFPSHSRLLTVRLAAMDVKQSQCRPCAQLPANFPTDPREPSHAAFCAEANPLLSARTGSGCLADQCPTYFFASVFPALGRTGTAAAGNSIGSSTYSQLNLEPGVCIAAGDSKSSFFPYAVGRTIGAGCTVRTYSDTVCSSTAILGRVRSSLMVGRRSATMRMGWSMGLRCRLWACRSTQ